MKYFFLLIILIVSCNSKNESIFGTYYSEKQTLFSNFSSFFLKEYRINRAVGLKLQLKSDSSFIENRCNVKIFGKWNIIKDTLILKSERFVFDKDSLINNIVFNEYDFCERNKIMKYKINFNSFEKIHFNQKGKKVLTKYVKSN